MKTVDNIFHELWTLRANSRFKDGEQYNKDEKRLWMLLQRFLEQKKARKTPASDYKV